MTDSPFRQSLTSLPFGGEPLPRHHQLSREAVGESQRGRLLHAVFDAVAAKGYANATIADIVERAAVSRAAFYQNFASKEACFRAAFESATLVVRNHMQPAIETAIGGPWRDLVHVSLRSYLELQEAEPAATWSMLVEIYAAGPDFVASSVDRLHLFGDLFRLIYQSARNEEPQRPELPPEVFDILASGIVNHVRVTLCTKGPNALVDLEPLLADYVFVFFGPPFGEQAPRPTTS